MSGSAWLKILETLPTASSELPRYVTSCVCLLACLLGSLFRCLVLCLCASLLVGLLVYSTPHDVCLDTYEL